MENRRNFIKKVSAGAAAMAMITRGFSRSGANYDATHDYIRRA